MRLLSPSDVLQKGLECLHIPICSQTSKAKKELEFHKHYGSWPLEVANLWYDLTTTDIVGALMTEKEKSESGFLMFMMAHFFLWSYPKNSHQLASRFHICERYSRGKDFWHWIGRIAAMKAKKIVWNSSSAEIFLVTIDGTDFRIWERKHPTLPRDNGQCSRKFNHGAVKYQIAVSVKDSKCVGIYGPNRGGYHDMTQLHDSGFLDKVAVGKLAIVDRVYKSKIPEEKAKLTLPNPMDSKEVNNFKSRARLRQETFNGRLKNFQILSETFTHGIEKHKLAFEAVVVIVQYQMDNGSPLYIV
jgi:hypothetical protein